MGDVSPLVKNILVSLAQIPMALRSGSLALALDLVPFAFPPEALALSHVWLKTCWYLSPNHV